MKKYDLILISQSDLVDYSGYSNLPLDRVDLYASLVYPRMVYFKGGFRSHLDVLNSIKNNRFYSECSPEERRNLLNIWNLPALAVFMLPIIFYSLASILKLLTTMILSLTN